MSPRRAMTCGEVRIRLPLVPGADLLPAEDQAVRDHLAACSACRRELGGFVRIRSELRGLGRANVADPDAFFADLRRDILAAVARESGGSGASRQRSGLRPTLTGVMTAAALFLIGIYLVAQWLPEEARVRDLPAVYAPMELAGPERAFRNVGYGLSGHRPRLVIQDMPLLGLDVAPEPEAPEPPAAGRRADRQPADPRPGGTRR